MSKRNQNSKIFSPCSVARSFVPSLIFGIVMCSPFFAAHAEKPATPEKVRLALNWKPEPQFGGFYAAQIAQLDKQHGVEFEIQPGGAGTPVVQMVAAGQIDFGIASGDEILVSRVRGSDVVALYAVYQTNPQGILTRADRGFESLGDVFKSSGTIAMQKGLPYALFLQRKYANGMKAAIVPYLGGISNFLSNKNHSQQCFVTSEPLLAQKRGTKVKTFLVAESGFNPYTTVLVTRASILKDKPELVKNVVSAVRAGWKLYLESPDEAHAKMNELNPSIDLASMKEMWEAQKALIESKENVTLGSMRSERWADLLEQLYSMKVISKKIEVAPIFVNL
ncbi:MAG: ABC transporter substrate-binding protein [Bdellovibrionales bacterium]|jgi:NitT/TauT family transport system substrate-binding protein|nr:ABC transporter substrate-binding protein [Bdellovibrionales bacterium]